MNVWTAVVLAALNAGTAEWGPWGSIAAPPFDRFTPAALHRTITETSNPVQLVGLLAIRTYHLLGSGPASWGRRTQGGGVSTCQFDPSCSRYTFGAIAAFGLWNGSVMGAERISRCHGFAPLAGYPEDPRSGRLADPVEHSHPPFAWLSRFGI